MKITDLYFESDLLKLEYSVEGLIGIEFKNGNTLQVEFSGVINCANGNGSQGFQFNFNKINSLGYINIYIQEFADDHAKQTELYELIKKQIIKEEKELK